MSEEQLINERKRKLEEIKNLGINPYPHKYERKNHIKEILEKHEKLKEKSSEIFQIAGRVMSIRNMGKVAFGNIDDLSGNIQFYIQRDDNPEQYKLFRLLDIGDIIGINGFVFRTKKGELSIHINKLTLLTKSLRPLPEKFHGLKDTEIRYRQRYSDLIMNRDVREIFIKRTSIIKLMREFLDNKGFLEVETPVLQTVYGGANAKPFTTHLNALDIDLFLSISPELYLKRLIVGGMEKVYTLCKNFRNEGIDKNHNPEFTMMECYEAYADYNDMMKLTESMVEYIVKSIHGKTKINYQGTIIDFKAPWQRMTMAEAIKKHVNIDVEKMSFEDLKEKCRELSIEPGESKDTAINAIFEDQCEKYLVQPVFITDYPKEICPLTKTHRKNPELVERFEGFVNAMELCNAYSELNDPVDQNERLKKQEQERQKGDEEANPMDSDFVRAMELGMPTTGGLGLGVDRLVMLLTDSPSIREVIFFPLMRPE